jgi:hypothetical protein
MSGLGAMLLLTGLLLVWLTYTKTTGQFVGALLGNA